MTIIFPCQLAEINPLSTDCTTIGANILYNLSKKNEKRKRAFAYTYLKIRMTYKLQQCLKFISMDQIMIIIDFKLDQIGQCLERPSGNQ